MRKSHLLSIFCVGISDVKFQLKDFNMANTYRAVLNGDHLEWVDDKPDDVGDEPLSVQVTILEETISEKKKTQGEMAAAWLQKIADRGGIKGIEDPVAWQREIRKDRPLPGRDE